MNKKQLEQILSPLHVSGVIPDGNYTKLATQLQNTTEGTIVFYRIQPGGQAEEIFANRYAAAHPSCLVLVNRACPSLKKRENIVVLGEEAFLSAQKLLADQFYPFEGKMKLVGVTGTNGKTTTVNLACQIAKIAGKRAFALGTLGITDETGKVIEDLNSTTPSYIELRRIFHTYQSSLDVLFMEVSSHALEQKRLGEFTLDAACWTSFSQDHLDYHSTMEQYFQAKCLLFQSYLRAEAPCYICADLSALFENVQGKEKLHLEIVREMIPLDRLPLHFRPRYNLDNLSLALSLNNHLWGEELVSGKMMDSWEKLRTPSGRFSVIPYGENLVIIDYAHTPDALENICKAIRESFPKYELITVFGCGGNRDRTKRPIMGRIAEEYSDYVIVTSDNPRYEDPELIIDDIIAGMKGSYERHSYRRQAIRQALAMLGQKQIVLIAGKGHEEYQEVKGIKRYFSDFEEVRIFMGEKHV